MSMLTLHRHARSRLIGGTPAGARRFVLPDFTCRTDAALHTNGGEKENAMKQMSFGIKPRLIEGGTQLVYVVDAYGECSINDEVVPAGRLEEFLRRVAADGVTATVGMSDTRRREIIDTIGTGVGYIEIHRIEGGSFDATLYPHAKGTLPETIGQEREDEDAIRHDVQAFIEKRGLSVAAKA